MHKYFERLRVGATCLFIFSTINDNYLEEHFGSFVLKGLILLCAVLNLQNLLSFNFKSKHNFPLSCVFVAMFLSFVTNIRLYGDNLSASINALIAVVLIAMIISRDKHPRVYMWAFVVSALFSSYLCVTTTATISEFTLRKTGGTGDPNEFSVTVIIPLFFLLGHYFKISGFPKKVLTLLAVFFFVIGLITAGSKSAMLTFLAGFFCFIVYALYAMKGMIRKGLVLFSIMILCGASAYIITTYYAETYTFVLNRFQEHGTADLRMASWKNGWELFMQYPFLGAGIGNYANMTMQFSHLAEGANAAHNMYVQSLAETGIFGFLCYLWCLFAVLYRQYKTRYLPAEIILAYIPLLVMGGTLSLFYEKYAWVMIALAYNRNFILPQETETLTNENH